MKTNELYADGDIFGGKVFGEVVESWTFAAHKKPGGPDSLRVEYRIDKATIYKEWVCLEHPGYPGDKAARWWARHNGRSPAPRTVPEALDRVNELAKPLTILVKKTGKYFEIIS